VPAITRLLYCGSIRLCGLPAPRTATHRCCLALLPEGRPFQRIHLHTQRVAGTPLPECPHHLIDIWRWPCRFCAVAAGLPALLTEPPCRVEGGVSPVPRSYQPAPAATHIQLQKLNIMLLRSLFSNSMPMGFRATT